MDTKNFKMSDKVTVTCYGRTKKMTRDEAIEYFEYGMDCCDPESSEYDRYAVIVYRLRSGETNVNDQEY